MADWPLKMSRQNVAYRGVRRVGQIDRSGLNMWIAKVFGAPVLSSTFRLRREAIAWIAEKTEQP